MKEITPIPYIPSEQDWARETALEILDNPLERPPTQVMVRIAESGFTDAMWRDVGSKLGYSSCEYTSTLRELETITPILQQVTDKIHRQYAEDHRLLYAARDGDLPYDDSYIRYPHPEYARSELIPASSTLWDSDSMKSLGERFLTMYGLDRESINDPDIKFTVIDSGFMGSVGVRLNDAVADIYGVNLIGAGRLDIRLISAEKGGHGSKITKIKADELPLSRRELPVTESQIGFREFESLAHKDPTALIANALEYLPRYHDAYVDLREAKDGHVIAVPELDIPKDPVGAAIVHQKFVESSLEKT